ncbi:NPCBM/NEW2 domain-containing protein [Demequina sp. NBRC 110054]|uniref:NPCBM/NEW2 domain-containing protein n=1 Tax=Demequina sp. NBRC 110054 TaxID=1570343 RepID=UPI00135661F3|nr:NPCBM/NEW2 domain-containing protein [Demequina sp. NBRC 110054]
MIKGTTSANLKGKRVVLQLKKGKKWVSTGYSAKVTSTKTYTLKFKPRGIGSQTYRVKYLGNANLKPSLAKKSITLWKWIGLAPREVSGDLYKDDVNMAGRYFSNAIVDYMSYYSDNGSYSDYNLSYKCVKIKARVGLDDGSDSGLKVRFKVALDGNTVYTSNSIGVGSSASFTKNTTGVFRVRLTMTSMDDSYRGYAAFAAPQILCKGYPAT